MATEGGHLERGFTLLELGRAAEAAEAARSVLAGDPQVVRGHELLTRAHLALDDHGAAMTAALGGLAVDPEDVWLNLLASVAAQRGGDPGPAYEYAQRAIRVAPFLPGAHLAAADAKIASRDDPLLTTAQRHVREARELAPNWAEVHYSQARIHALRNEVGSAKYCLRTVLELEPDHQSAQVFLADLDRHTGDSGKAVDLLHTALQLDPNDERARIRLDDLIREAMVSVAWLSFAIGVVAALVIAVVFDSGGGA